MKEINNFKHKEKLNHKKLHIFSVITFLMGFASSLLAYVMSSYLKEILKTDNVSVIFLIAYSIVLVMLLNLHHVVRIFGKSFLFNVAFMLKIISVVGLLLFPLSGVGIGFLMLYIVSGTLAWTVMDGIIESFSADKESGRIRGAHLAIANLGFLMGPLLSTIILEKYGFSGIFLLSLIVYSVIFVIALVSSRHTNHQFKKKITIKEIFKKVSKRSNILRVYYLSFALEFFYALMVVYAPLYLLGRGFNWEQLGVAFTIMLVPFVLIQYPIGVLADKKTGEKEFLVFSLFILGSAAVLFYIIDSSSILVWTTVLILSRVGAALLEILRESYFYKRIDGNDVELIDFFKTAKPVAFIIASFLAMILLSFFPIKIIFILIAAVAFSAIYPAFKLVDNFSEKEAL